MSLLEHLGELRTRLWKSVVAICLLGGLSLWYSRDLFQILMRPVLAALPEDGRHLIYTSGIEEINVLLRVGLYAGLFLGAPVILYQLWKFIAPGLYPPERKLVMPFVTLGTLFFVGGAVFCYFAVLPRTFEFLLTESDEHQLHQRSILARAQEADAARLLALGEVEKAGALVAQARGFLLKKGEGAVEEPAQAVDATSLEELKSRDALYARHLDDAVRLATSKDAKAALAAAIEAHGAAEQALSERDAAVASQKLDQSAQQLAAVYDGSAGKGAGPVFSGLWRLDRHLGAAQQRESAIEWTRPMLSMSEQLSLVLMFEVAFGLIFELPLIMTLLAWLGVVKPSFLAKYQRHAIVLCVVAAAVITPSGDAVNLSLMAVPMIVCYELGVLGAFIVGRRRARNRAKLEVAP